MQLSPHGFEFGPQCLQQVRAGGGCGAWAGGLLVAIVTGVGAGGLVVGILTNVGVGGGLGL